MGQSRHRRPIRIAIADDHTLLRHGLRKLFEDQADMEVVAETATGDGILQVLKQSDANILLLDLEMPDVDGFDVLRNMHVAGFQIPTLVLTEGEGRIDLRTALDLGASGVISKSAATPQLLIAIREVYQGLTWVDRGLEKRNGVTLPADDPLRRAGQGSADASPGSELTARETEVVALVSQGLRYKQIADRLNMSPHTLNNHLRHIFDKLRVKGRVELALYGLKHKI